MCAGLEARAPAVIVTRQLPATSLKSVPTSALDQSPFPPPVSEVAHTAPSGTRVFDILIEKSKNGGVGLDISAHDGATLLIGRIWEDGPVDRWNVMCGLGSPKVVRETDRIVEVNGAGGDAERILDALKVTTTLSMKIRRRLSVDGLLGQGAAELQSAQVEQQSVVAGGDIAKVCGPVSVGVDARADPAASATTTEATADTEATAGVAGSAPTASPAQPLAEQAESALSAVVPETLLQPPRAKTQEFDIHIEKEYEGQGIGLDISTQDGKTLLIGRVRDGPIDRWNVELSDEDCFEFVKKGDRIVEVNGVGSTCDAILAVLKSTNVLSMKIRRMVEFEVSLDRAGRIGLHVDQGNIEQLIIRGVTNGPIKELNRVSRCDLEIRRGDRIAEVNGVSGEARVLMDVVHRATDLRLFIKRPTPD